jgi:hypothetical protein
MEILGVLLVVWGLGNRLEAGFAGQRRAGRTADAVIDKTGIGHVLRLVNVAQVNDDRGA